ncbi:MAG: flagellar hook protein FlgE [Aestuariivirga sp.]
MSLYGVMRTSTSGMAAQATRISTVAENVANSNTVGYKAVRTEFSSIFINNNVSSFNSGAVDTNIHRIVDNQGTLQATGSVTDLAIDGDGFMLVRNASGENFMTRAGSFIPDGNGTLVNTGGYQLLGYPLTSGNPTVVVNGYTGLVPVSVSDVALVAQPTTTGTFAANLPSTAAITAAANLPSANAAGSTYTAKSSLVTYGNLGEEVTLDVYFAKTATNQWEVSVYNSADAATGGGFPYASGALTTQTLDFDPNNGQLDASSVNALSIAIPGGQPLDLDLSNMSQLATGYSVLSAKVDGNAASAAEIVEISNDGTLFVSFANGTRRPLFRVPIATVTSPDNLASISGNAFAPTSKSGDIRIGFPGEAGLGNLKSGVLEQSTTDIASEFTDMIDAQRNYTANSKVFQTGAELMDVLVNLKR